MRLKVPVLACATLAWGHDLITTKITWSREVSRIVYSHCASCHHDGGSAFSLITYTSARPWAKAIKEEVLERRMPPWNAVKGFGDFRDDQGLTQEDLEILSAWVEGGAPEGDPKLLPPVPRFDAASKPASTPAGTEIVIDGRRTLDRPVTVSGIRARSLTEGASIQVYALLPDGRTEPLIWLYNYQHKWDRTYWFRDPLDLPAGTIVEASPASSGAVALVAAHRAVASSVPSPAR
jgi:hypothetical protein